MEALSYSTHFPTYANYSHFIIIGGKWKTNRWIKDCDDCYMCKSPWMIWCPGVAWFDSFPASAVRCVYSTLTWRSQDLITYITSPTAYLMALLLECFTLSFVWFEKVLSNVWSCNQELVAIEPSTPPSYQRRRKHCFSNAQLQHPHHHRP